MRTPREDGFFMPAEWAPQTQVWTIWPERADSWRAGAVPAQQAFSTMIRAIARFTPVTLCASAASFVQASEALAGEPRVRVVELSNDDTWMRDCGPTFLVDGRGGLAGVDWDFNAWGGEQGGLYPSWDLDALVARKVLQMERVQRYATPGFVLEGGSIHVDGEGTLITTEECLLNPNRNPHLDRAQIEALLREYTGAHTIIWLPRGLDGDETDGHVDNFCCFVRPGEVLLSWTDDKSDPNYQRCREALAVLEASTDARGRPLQAHKMPLPAPIYAILERDGGAVGIAADEHGKPPRLAASYINFLISNDGIIAPGFDDPMDAEALSILRALFPRHHVLMCPGREILLGGGNIHCVTQQQPRPC
jgi:agmatine deiminase